MLQTLQDVQRKLRSLSRSTIKYAALGGDGNDTSFEKLFSDAAHAYLKDKAPSLMPYEQGFQVVEQANDNNNAFGVIGFKVAGMQIFAPIFFINGELKGHEMLYLADQDCFIPLKEAWVQEVFRREPVLLGATVQKNTQTDVPDLSHIVDMPSKYASYLEDYTKIAVRNFIPIASVGKSKEGIKRLRQKTASSVNPMLYLNDASETGLVALQQMLKKYPMLRKGFDAAHTKQAMYTLDNTIEASRHRDKVLHVTEPLLSKAADAGIRVFTPADVLERGIILTSQEKEKLLHTGCLVHDFRKKASTLVTLTEEKSFNPTETGFYDVLMEPGEKKRRLIVMLPTISSDIGMPSGKLCMIMELSSRNAIVALTREVFCTHKYPDALYRKWFRSLQRTIPNKIDNDKRNTEFLFITEAGSATPLLNTSYGEPKYIDSDKLTTFFCRSSGTNTRYCCSNDCCGTCTDVTKVTTGYPEGSRLHISGSELRVPNTARALSVTIQDRGKALLAPQQYLRAKSASCDVIKLSAFDSECSINNQPRESVLTTFKTLLMDYGLREKEAKYCIQTAQKQPYHTHRFTIKRAEEAGLVPDTDIPLQLPQPREADREGLRFSGRMLTDDEQLVRANRPIERRKPADSDYASEDVMTAQRAMSSGQKDIFDVTLLKQLLTTTDNELASAQSTKKLMHAMNTVGRELFSFYWNKDLYAELYTERVLPELENNLVTTFEKLGDIILFRQRNKVQPTASDRDAPWVSLAPEG